MYFTSAKLCTVYNILHSLICCKMDVTLLSVNFPFPVIIGVNFPTNFPQII